MRLISKKNNFLQIDQLGKFQIKFKRTAKVRSGLHKELH